MNVLGMWIASIVEPPSPRCISTAHNSVVPDRILDAPVPSSLKALGNGIAITAPAGIMGNVKASYHTTGTRSVQHPRVVVRTAPLVGGVTNCSVEGFVPARRKGINLLTKVARLPATRHFFPVQGPGSSAQLASNWLVPSSRCASQWYSSSLLVLKPTPSKRALSSKICL